MMHVAVTKRFTFEAAHHLPKHEGKCRQLHGHSYVVDVSISGPLALSGSSEGMVIDFADITAFWKSDLEPRLDHRYLNDELAIVPTAEMLAVWLCAAFNEWARRQERRVEFVRVWETQTAYAEARP